MERYTVRILNLNNHEIHVRKIDGGSVVIYPTKFADLETDQIHFRDFIRPFKKIQVQRLTNWEAGTTAGYGDIQIPVDPLATESIEDDAEEENTNSGDAKLASTGDDSYKSYGEDEDLMADDIDILSEALIDSTESSKAD